MSGSQYAETVKIEAASSSECLAELTTGSGCGKIVIVLSGLVCHCMLSVGLTSVEFELSDKERDVISERAEDEKRLLGVKGEYAGRLPNRSTRSTSGEPMSRRSAYLV